MNGNPDFFIIPTENSSSSLPRNLSIQQAVLAVGGMNLYQLRVFLIFASQWAITTFLLVSAPLIFLPPSFLCSGGNHCTEDDGGCDQTPLLIDPASLDTVSKEFGLYCSKRALRDFAASSVFIGALIGNLVFSLVSIKRKPHLIFTWLVGSIGCFGLSFSPNIYAFITFYMIAGFGCLTAIFVHFAVMSEQGSERFAQLGTLGCMVAWSVAEMITSGILYGVREWRTALLWFLGVPALVLNIANLFIFESPKFAYLTSRDEALSILNRMARINGKPLINSEDLAISEQRTTSHRKHTILDLFRHRSMRTPTVILILAHLLIEMFYWGTGFSLPYLGTSIYLNMLFFGVVEMIAYFSAEIVVRKVRRKVCFVVLGTLCTILSFVFYFMDLPESCLNSLCPLKVIKTILVMIARGLVCLSVSVMFVYFSEVFPTSVKAIGILISYASGSIGSVSAPYIVDYAQSLHIPPMVFLGIVVGVQTVSCFWLKETFGKKSGELIEDHLEIDAENDSKGMLDLK